MTEGWREPGAYGPGPTPRDRLWQLETATRSWSRGWVDPYFAARESDLLTTSAFGSLPDVPCAYVMCTEDTILPPATQREMAARLGVEPVDLASDHAVFTLRPHELAPLLVG